MKSVYPEELWKRVESDPHEMLIFRHLIKGNLYAFMNKLLDFKPGEEIHPWVPKKKRRYGAQ